MVYVIYFILFQCIRMIESEKNTISMTFYDYFYENCEFNFFSLKTRKTYFLKSVLEINRLPKKEAFAEMKSHIKPLALARLSVVAPLLT